jgi:hypothetical protein
MRGTIYLKVEGLRSEIRRLELEPEQISPYLEPSDLESLDELLEEMRRLRLELELLWRAMPDLDGLEKSRLNSLLRELDQDPLTSLRESPVANKRVDEVLNRLRFLNESARRRTLPGLPDDPRGSATPTGKSPR